LLGAAYAAHIRRWNANEIATLGDPNLRRSAMLNRCRWERIYRDIRCFSLIAVDRRTPVSDRIGLEAFVRDR